MDEGLLAEHWVAIQGFPNYEVSNYGRIVNVDTQRDLKPTMDKFGYLKVGLYRNGVCTKFLVHRVVAQAFFLNYHAARAVNFINDIRTDCTVLNLTLGDRRTRAMGVK